ncbi:MAG: lipocalin-like domain-containing protein [Acetobacteraceae bacterium]|nr:lipocalin-like domain-containing protein [Acetobacteraceae bacterium]
MEDNPRSDLNLLIGSWRLISAVSTFTDGSGHVEPWGPGPEGRMVLEPGGRIMFLFAPRGRVAPTTDDDRVTMFNELLAYTALVRFDGPGKLVFSVDLAMNPAWDTELVRYYEIRGDDLVIRTPEMRSARHQGRPSTAVITFKREHRNS